MENHVEEIVDGIDRALSQAQELREKISINISKQKRKMREPDVQSLYLPMGSNKLNARRQQPLKKIATKVSKTETNSELSTVPSSNKILKASPVDVEKKSSTSTVETKSKSITEKKHQLSASNKTASKPVAKGKSVKNFVAANKSNIKNIKRNSKSPIPMNDMFKSKQSGDFGCSRETSETMRNYSTSIAELNTLMDKVSLESTKTQSTNCLQSKSSSCPCHDTNDEQFVEGRVRTTVDMIDGLDRFSVPGDIVKLLKIYHSYSNKELSSDSVIDKRSERAANKFLAEFDRMNGERGAQRNSNDSSLTDLTTDFLSLLRDLQQLPLQNIDVNAMSTRYKKLDSQSKSFGLEKFSSSELRKIGTSMNAQKYRVNSRGWSSNGIWNRIDDDSFYSAIHIHRIRYAHKGQLLTLFELHQRLQQLLYQRDMMEMLMEKIIPYVLGRFHQNSTEYCECYKMIVTIAQILNPRIPVLVRTDI